MGVCDYVVKYVDPMLLVEIGDFLPGIDFLRIDRCKATVETYWRLVDFVNMFLDIFYSFIGTPVHTNQ